jgi:hypothetical protein
VPDGQRETDRRSAQANTLEIHQANDQPWKGPVEQEQQGGARKEDLEKWKGTDTH